MKLKLAMTFWLSVLLFASVGVRADDASTQAKVDAPAAPQTDVAPTTVAQRDASPATAPQIDPAVMSQAMAQAAKILAQSQGDTAVPAAGQSADKTSAPSTQGEAESDPAVAAAMAQATKILAQSLGDPATVAAMQKQARALSDSGDRDGRQLARENAPKLEGDDSRQAAQAELEEAQKMADAALASAPQAAAAASTTATCALGNGALSARSRTVTVHSSMNGLVDSAQSLGPDPSDKSHHSMDSMF
jgi:hypothetical protein